MPDRDRSADRIRRRPERDAHVLEIDAPELARGAVDPDESLYFGTGVAVARDERQGELRAGRIVAHIGKNAEAVPPRESGGQEDRFVGRIEVLRPVVVMLEVAVPFQQG